MMGGWRVQNDGGGFGAERIVQVMVQFVRFVAVLSRRDRDWGIRRRRSAASTKCGCIANVYIYIYM